MELQLVSFVQAKTLKELGFDYPTNYWYGDYYDDEDDPEHRMGIMAASIPTYVQNWNDTVKFPINKNDEFDNVYSAPTLELAAKWLMQEHGFIFQILPITGWVCRVQQFDRPFKEYIPLGK